MNAEAAAEILADLEAKAERLETPCGDGAMVWRRWGAGPPLVLIHGGHGAWSHWARNIEGLSETRAVWAPDIPGFGDSTNAPRRDDGDSIADVIADGLQEVLGPGVQADLVGFSTGGVVAAYVAARHAELFRRLILVDAGGLGTPMGEGQPTGVRGLEGEALRAAHRFNLSLRMFHDHACIDELAMVIQGLNVPKGRADARKLVLPHALLNTLPQIALQIDAIWGEFDAPHPHPQKHHAVLRTFQPNCEMRVIPDAGHWVMYERPQAFNSALLGLLDQPLRGL